MPEELSHDEIARRFVQSKALDFDAIGKFFAELGPDLAVNDRGFHGAIFGRYNILACMIPAADAVRLVGNLRGASFVAGAMEGGE
jgi:hypothetical protein